MLLYLGAKREKKAEERDKQSLATPALRLSLSASLHQPIPADLYASGAKQTNIIFSVSRL